MTESVKHYNFKDTEKKWQQYWELHKIYSWNKNATREESFIVDTPPPTVSGQLHMGHIFSYTQADFVVRFQRMRGKNIFYPIGFDDNGLPTERLVEKQRKVKASAIPRAEFIEICKEVVKSEEIKFREFFNNIAISVDWSCEYQTISQNSQTISQMSFLDLVQKGKIYRSEQPILWDPVDQTALAQADVEDKEFPSFMNEIIFETDEKEQIKIATTRPELLPACVAVFFNPEDDRYKHLEGKFAITPIFKSKVPILADSMVSIEKGTGLVMCCTFGDMTDVAWWKTYKLPLKNLINKYGKIANLEFGEDCLDKAAANSFLSTMLGLKAADARAKIIEHLREIGLLTKQDPITHNVKCAERSGAPLEIITTPQWFIKTVEHKEDLLKRASEINWRPQYMRQRLESWINSIAWDWCISRQRFFGVAIPVWYSKRQGEEGKAIFADASKLPVDPMRDLPNGYTADEVEPEKDVMDTWATSSISPQLSSRGISEEFTLDAERHSKLFPCDLRPQGHEIIRTWAFYTILKSHLHQNCIPWKNIMISGWCLAEDKTKMSKSKGNIIEPQGLIDTYGSDVVRYWASTSRLGADTAYSEEIIKDGKRLVSKLWNSSKFASMHLAKVSEFGESAKNDRIYISTDLWILSKLHKVMKQATESFEVFEYAIATECVEHFFWKDFCDNYLEIVKVRIYNEKAPDTKAMESGILTIHFVLSGLLKLFAPILPHITEELFATIFGQTKSIHSQFTWPDYNSLPYDEHAIKLGDYMLDTIEVVRKAKAERNLSVKAPLSKLEIFAPVALPADMLKDIRNAAAVEVRNISGEEVKITQGDIVITIGF